MLLDTYHFDNDIVTKLFRRWKKEYESNENNAKNDFEKKEEWYRKNSTEEFRRDTPKETLKTIDMTIQT